MRLTKCFGWIKHPITTDQRIGKIFLSALPLLIAVAASTTTLITTQMPELVSKPIDQLITAASIYKHDLAVIDLDTLEMTWITDDDTVEQEPCWSPDGKYILYSAIDDAWHELRLLNLETGEKKTLLAEEGVSLLAPDWNVMGDLLFERRFVEARQPGELATASITPSAISNIRGTGKRAFQAAWAPGEEMLFTTYEGGPNARKFEINRANDGRMESTARLEIDMPLDFSQPAISFDGEHLAFRGSMAGLGDIFVRTPRKMIQVTENIYEDAYPSWAPDGESLYYSSDRSGAFQIYRSNLKGDEEHITKNEAFDFTQPAVSPSGRQLVVKTVTLRNSADAAASHPAIRHPVFQGKFHYWDRTNLISMSPGTMWRIRHQVGSLALGKHGELIVLHNGQMGTGDIVACRVDDELVLCAMQSAAAFPFARVDKRGNVKVEPNVASYYPLTLQLKLEYPKWEHMRDGIPILPNRGTLILPEGLEESIDDPDIIGWAIELADGIWMGAPKDRKPIKGAMTFRRTPDGGLSVSILSNDGMQTPQFEIASDRKMIYRAEGRFPARNTWPFVNFKHNVYAIPHLHEFNFMDREYVAPTIYSEESEKITLPYIEVAGHRIDNGLIQRPEAWKLEFEGSTTSQ